jgi:hypothetical protein
MSLTFHRSVVVGWNEWSAKEISNPTQKSLKININKNLNIKSEWERDNSQKKYDTMELHYYTITTKSPQHDASGNVKKRHKMAVSLFIFLLLLMEWNTMEENYILFLLFVNTSCGVFLYFFSQFYSTSTLYISPL